MARSAEINQIGGLELAGIENTEVVELGALDGGDVVPARPRDIPRK